MRAAWASAPATGLWRTCSRSRAFHGGIFVDEAASTNWSKPLFAFDWGAMGLPVSMRV